MNFHLNFTEHLSLYVLVGSQPCPDAETLVIPLMQMQIVGVPFRNHDGEDWMFMSWQDLDYVVIQSSVMPGWYFRLVTRAFFIVGVVV